MDHDPDEYIEDEHAEEDDEDIAPTLQRRTLDPSVADVLREEAAREAAARQAENAGGLESQPDLGLEEAGAAAARSAAARQRMARLRGRDPDEAETGNGHGGTARRELLPDVEEINSTLRGEEDRDDSYAEDADTEETGRKAFRAGFLIVVLICALLIAVYALAPRIAAAIPAAEPVLTAYVDWMNMAREQINGTVDTLATKLRDFSAGFGGGDGE